MRRSLAILCLLAGLAAAPLITHAQQPVSPSNELYVGAFLSARKGEELAAAGDSKGALAEYRRAADALSQIKQQFPTWQKELLDFRLTRVNEAIAQLQAKIAADGGGGNAPGGPARPSPITPGDILPPLRGRRIKTLVRRMTCRPSLQETIRSPKARAL